ncbi:hypothetical protein MPC1_3130005 [Methylocella tundrae]|nr:hypothetical protein MPC1_3130005 [Methylocella tundrae]
MAALRNRAIASKEAEPDAAENAEGAA